MLRTNKFFTQKKVHEDHFPIYPHLRKSNKSAPQFENYFAVVASISLPNNSTAQEQENVIYLLHSRNFSSNEEEEIKIYHVRNEESSNLYTTMKKSRPCDLSLALFRDY
jgi:hypothetical protein